MEGAHAWARGAEGATLPAAEWWRRPAFVQPQCLDRPAGLAAAAMARCSAAAGKAVDVLLEEYADSSAAGEGASHPALTHDGQAREIRTCAHAGSTEQAPQPMSEDNPESVRSTVTMSTPAIPGHGTSITCADVKNHIL